MGEHVFWWEGPSTLWAFWTDLSCGSRPASSRLGWAGLGWAGRHCSVGRRMRAGPRRGEGSPQHAGASPTCQSLEPPSHIFHKMASKIRFYFSF